MRKNILVPVSSEEYDTLRPPRRRVSGASKRIVLKVGSRLITDGGREPSRDRLAALAAAVVGAPGTEVVIVSSGAVAAGFSQLGFDAPPKKTADRQAAAAVGQSRLMNMWGQVFRELGREVGQILLTNDGLRDRQRYLAARGAMGALLDAGVIPIVNENDTVSVREIMVGDNDNLAAMTAALVDADLLVLLTDVDGVFDGNPSTDPKARAIPFARSPQELREFCYKKTSAESTGGMATKLEAADKAGRYGIPTIISAGANDESVRAVLRGEARGTYIAANKRPLRARRHWMSTQTGLAGAVVVDDGAAAAIRLRASLLPKGILEVVGRFRKGDLISVRDRSGAELARGIARYDDRDVDRIRGLHSSQVGPVLGRPGGDVVMRPDRMVLLDTGGVA